MSSSTHSSLKTTPKCMEEVEQIFDDLYHHNPLQHLTFPPPPYYSICNLFRCPALLPLPHQCPTSTPSGDPLIVAKDDAIGPRPLNPHRSSFLGMHGWLSYRPPHHRQRRHCRRSNLHYHRSYYPLALPHRPYTH